LISVADNIRRLREEIAGAALRYGRDPADVALMAVTKTQPPELVNEALAAGVRLLGENRAQELLEKYDRYDKTVLPEIHFIGHLQTNKIKMVVGRVCMVQSVDSLKLAAAISKQSVKQGVDTGLLIEINIAGEGSKSGIRPEDAEALAREIAELPGVTLRGLMTIPPIWNQYQENERFFAQMQQLFVDIRRKNIDNTCMDILSMGMSDDFAVAIKHGSTLVRLGTAIFGRRI